MDCLPPSRTGLPEAFTIMIISRHPVFGKTFARKIILNFLKLFAASIDEKPGEV